MSCTHKCHISLHRRRLRGFLVGVVFLFVHLISGSFGLELWHRARQPLSERRNFATGNPAGAEGKGVHPLKKGNGQREENQRGGMSEFHAQHWTCDSISSPSVTKCQILGHYFAPNVHIVLLFH